MLRCLVVWGVKVPGDLWGCRFRVMLRGVGCGSVGVCVGGVWVCVYKRMSNCYALQSLSYHQIKLYSVIYLFQLPLCLLMLSGDNVYTLISYFSVSRWIFLAVAAAVIPYHRLKYPDVKRPFTVSNHRVFQGPLIVLLLYFD